MTVQCHMTICAVSCSVHCGIQVPNSNMYTIQLLLHVVVCYCVRCVYVTDFFTVRVEPFVPGHVPLSRLCAGPYIPVASRYTDSQ